MFGQSLSVCVCVYANLLIELYCSNKLSSNTKCFVYLNSLTLDTVPSQMNPIHALHILLIYDEVQYYSPK